MRKENKNNNIIQQFVTSASPWSHFREYHIRKQRMYTDTLFTLWSKSKQHIHVRCYWHRTAYAVYVCDTPQNNAWHGGDKLLNKVIIFVFLAYKKYSRSFVKFWLNNWCHMDYFTDVLATFLSLDRVRILAVYGRVRKLSECIKNILICVLKMNEGLTGLERHEGE